MPVRKISVLSRAAAPLLVALPWVLGGAQAAAQDYAVVQPLPPPAAGELSAALKRLARSPSDFDALIAAGRASLALGDIDAATGFFGRADAVRPGDARVKAGLAVAHLKSDRPIEALQLFDQALAAGASPASVAGDRGLAYDLVGDNVSAQAQYRLALSHGPDAEISRRLGLSQAISGDRKGFEATLLPLLQRRDFAAYRARAFGLAILGDNDEAVSIVEAVMPRDLASRITPYLAYMPKLTRAQQAATGNLGAFPRAAQIGRDDPRFAQYAGPASAMPVAGSADSRLAPTGAPLGPKVAAAAPRQTAADRKRQRDEAKRQAAAAEPPKQAAVTPARKPPVTISRIYPPAAQVVQQAAPPPPPPAAPPPPPPPPPAAPPVIVLPAQAQPQPVLVQELPASSAAPAVPLAPVQGPPAAQAEPVQQQTPVVVVPDPPSAAPAADEASVADAFADLFSASGVTAPSAGAVDITAIKPKREVAEPPQAAKPKAAPLPPPPPKAKVPSRVWVQVATGRDVKALGFDWRKLGKKAPALLGKRDAFTAKWGETRRLVTGPFDTAKAANTFVADLKKAGIDAFTFTSEAGEDIAPLK